MRALSPGHVKALRDLRAAFPDAEIAIIGAAALAFHIDMTWRKTEDLDLAIAVSVADLDEKKLRGWERDPKKHQRWKIGKGILVDLVPAPPEALEQGEFVWPGTENRMNLTGVRQALKCQQIPVDEGLSIAVATVPVIALLKMAAYLDRPHEREKDLQDISQILNSYPDDDRLFSDEFMATGIGVPALNGHILGRDLYAIVDDRERKVVNEFFRAMDEDAHWGRWVRSSPWRYKESELRIRVDALHKAFAAPEPRPIVAHGAHAISVEFVVNGESVRMEIGTAEPLSDAVRVALAQSGNLGRPPEEWELRTEAGALLDQSQSAKDHSLGNGAVLYLTLKIGAGGDAA